MKRLAVAGATSLLAFSLAVCGAKSSGEVVTFYLSYPKSKPKNHLFSGVISVRILWLGVQDSNL